MNHSSEAAVRPRRNLLTALWVWAVGLWGSSQLLAAADPKSGKSSHHKAVLKDYELTILIGRLCVDDAFRKEFFESKSLDKKAKDLLAKKKMITRADMPDKADKILKAHKSPQNPVEDACASVSSALLTALGRGSCPDWPC